VASGTVTGKITVTTPTGTLTSADDFVIQHERTISLNLSRSLRASGRVVCLDGTTACASGAEVKIQRRIDGSWKTVKTTVTDGAGNYGVHVQDKSGKYRAIASKGFLNNDDICKKARSSVEVN
jgi:hypothetical protein